MPAAGVSDRLGADQGQHGGEGEGAGVDAGAGGCLRRDGGDHVVDEHQRPGFLADERDGAAAQDAARAAYGFLQVQERGFGGLPPPRAGLQVRDDPDLRLGAALRDPDSAASTGSLNTPAVVPSKTVSSRPNAVPGFTGTPGIPNTLARVRSYP
jgi:hypothetical protein